MQQGFNVKVIFKLGAATLVKLTCEPFYYPSKTLSHENLLNVIHTEWFDTISNETLCWIKCTKKKKWKK